MQRAASIAKAIRVAFTATLVGVLLPVSALAQTDTLNLVWDASSSTDIDHYNVYVGTSTGAYDLAVRTVSDTAYTFASTPGVRYYFAVSAVSTAGLESPISGEISGAVPFVFPVVSRVDTVGLSISAVRMTAVDPDGGTLRFSHTGLPLGLALDSVTGIISGTPASIGTYNVTIFVSDGLSISSTSFGWTVRGPGSGDSMAPRLSITSHSAGQRVNVASITLSGTATDSGSGDNGIINVRINGQLAAGGTASGSGTANWSRSVSLTSGINTILVEAQDGSGNYAAEQITVTRDSTPPTISIASHTSGQVVNVSGITLSGTATDSGAGGSGITRVTVNGGATSASATENNTAGWSRSLTLLGGANTVSVVATDGAGNVRTTTTTITYTPPAAVVTADSVTPASGSGASQTFALQYASNLGATNLSTAWVWFNSTLASSSANSCLVYYNRPSATMYLVNDAATQWTSSPLSTGATVQNSQCSVSLAESSVNVSGTTLTLNLAVTFKPVFAGTKNIYMYGANVGSVNSGWQTRGSWTLPGGSSGSAVVEQRAQSITADAVTPNAGSGATQSFALSYSDSIGATDLSTAWVWFNGTLASSSARSCLVYYDRAARTVNLVNDTGTQWMSNSLTSGATLQNSQCSVSLAGSSAATSGTTLTLNLAVTFKPAFAGTKNIYMFGASATIGNSGWQDRGDWVVEGNTSPSTATATTTVTADSATPSSGAGAMQAFSLQYSNTLGAADLKTVMVWFSPAFTSSGSNTCMLYYDLATARLYVLSNNASVWTPGMLGGGATLDNGQCSVRLGSSSVTTSGNTLTLNLAITFSSEFSGPKMLYMYAESAAGVNSAWQTRGSWTVP
jgi:hypothetical protein